VISPLWIGSSARYAKASSYSKRLDRKRASRKKLAAAGSEGSVLKAKDISGQMKRADLAATVRQ
jgi:hypothetical protein